MYQPEAYGIALLFMIGSMLCWGSWANTMKLTPGWAFQLFYWDYVIGIIWQASCGDSRSAVLVEENSPSSGISAVRMQLISSSLCSAERSSMWQTSCWLPQLTLPAWP